MSHAIVIVMSHSIVHIGKNVSYERLEAALRKAAERVGWNVAVDNIFYKAYRLGSAEKVDEYNHTEVNLGGRMLTAMTVLVYGRGQTDVFDVRAGFPDGFARKRRVMQYLSAVSDNLK